MTSRAAPAATLIVVDDDRDVVDGLALLLEQAGHRVHAFTSPLDALAFSRRHAFDAAILDVTMPGLDGIGLARRLQADSGSRGVSIAFHTSLDESDVRAAFAGYRLYLRKPSLGGTIVEEIDRLLAELNAVFLYVSALAPAASPGDVGAITRQSRVNNAAHGISGLLVFDGESFVQLVEGPSYAIAALRERLLRDPRHHRVEPLSFRIADGPRRFAGWQLGYHAVDAADGGLERLRGLRDDEAFAAFEALLPAVDVGAGSALPA